MALRRPWKLLFTVVVFALGTWEFRHWATVPLGPDRPELAKFAPAPAAAPVSVEVTPLLLGRALAPRCAAAGKASCLAVSEIVHAAYLVRHPKATFLIDAGVRANASHDDLARFPFWLRMAFDFEQQRGLGEALKAAGNPKLDFVVLTHAHWDHASGLRDLDHPKVVVGPGEEGFIRDFPKDAIPSVMPEHFQGASLGSFAWDGPPVENFPASHDLLGDGSVLLVPLPGHTPGSLGVLVSGVHGKRLLFIGDAGWSRDAVELPSIKLKPMAMLVDHDWPQESETVWRLHHLHQHDPSLVIVPAHDGTALREVAALGSAK